MPKSSREKMWQSWPYARDEAMSHIKHQETKSHRMSRWAAACANGGAFGGGERNNPARAAPHLLNAIWLSIKSGGDAAVHGWSVIVTARESACRTLRATRNPSRASPLPIISQSQCETNINHHRGISQNAKYQIMEISYLLRALFLAFKAKRYINMRNESVRFVEWRLADKQASLCSGRFAKWHTEMKKYQPLPALNAYKEMAW